MRAGHPPVPLEFRIDARVVVWAGGDQRSGSARILVDVYAIVRVVRHELLRGREVDVRAVGRHAPKVNVGVTVSAGRAL